MKTIGLTGGIGSGKTTVALIFEHLGIPVFNADLSGRRVLGHDSVRSAIIELLGPKAYDGDEANRSYISKRVFADASELEALNGIIHPAVKQDFIDWKAKQSGAYCLREAAILFESGSHVDCDKVVCVSAPDEIRISRVVKRDNVTAEQVKSRMANQMNQEEREKRSDYIIQNSGTEALIPQVSKIHQILEDPSFG